MAIQGLIIHIVDAGAYLNSTLEETIYMQQAPGYEDGMDQVYHLLLTLYGLKQSGQVWNEKLNKTFLGLRYMHLFADQCTYIRKSDQNLMIIAAHMDDMAIFASDTKIMQTAKDELKKYFETTDLGEVRQIVGLEVT